LASTRIIILAAGGSSRLGQPKQLLLYQGRTLIRHACDTALASQCRPVVVVVGAYGERVRREIAELPITIVNNSAWADGLGSSLRVGMGALQDNSEPIDAAIVMLCDQPLVTPELLDGLAQTYLATNAPIVAAEYAGTRGVPALFSRALWPELLALDNAGGAKSVIVRHAAEVAGFPFPEAATDIDTPDSYNALRQTLPSSVDF
jgi:molybdenum cofactor cytidylyltransferase